MTTSWTPAAISAAPKLTACWAEPHWRSTVVAAASIGRPSCSQALRATLSACSPNCCDAAGDDVLDLGRIDAGAAEDLGVGLAEQRSRVRVLVVALLLVPAPDRRAHGLDDDDLAALLPLHRGDPSVTKLTAAVRYFTPRMSERLGIAGSARSPADWPLRPPSTASRALGAVGDVGRARRGNRGEVRQADRRGQPTACRWSATSRR